MIFRIFIVLLCMILGMDASAADSQRYNACTHKVNSDPSLALKEANNWLAQEKNPSARHCRALALYGLQRYADAAFELERLALDIPPQQAALKISLFDQASTARVLALQPTKALGNLSTAIILASQHELTDRLHLLLLSRARLYRQMNKPLEALQDLDHLLSLEQNHKNALRERISLYTALKKKTLAARDSAVYRKLYPQEKE